MNWHWFLAVAIPFGLITLSALVTGWVGRRRGQGDRMAARRRPTAEQVRRQAIRDMYADEIFRNGGRL